MNITIARQADIRANIKKFFDMAYAGETVIVPRKENKNIVILSEHEYKRMNKARKNAEYIAMLKRSEKEFKDKKTVTKTISELEELLNE
jgi:antitoxin YefM